MNNRFLCEHGLLYTAILSCVRYVLLLVKNDITLQYCTYYNYNSAWIIFGFIWGTLCCNSLHVANPGYYNGNVRFVVQRSIVPRLTFAECKEWSKESWNSLAAQSLLLLCKRLHQYFTILKLHCFSSLSPSDPKLLLVSLTFENSQHKVLLHLCTLMWSCS